VRALLDFLSEHLAEDDPLRDPHERGAGCALPAS